MFNLMKVFDCSHMPGDVRSAFFDAVAHRDANETFTDWTVHGEGVDLEDGYDASTEDIEIRGKVDLIDAWLIAAGASPEEEVLIKHWW